MQKRRAGQRYKALRLRAPHSPLLHTGMHLRADNIRCHSCGWQSQPYCLHDPIHQNASPEVWRHAKAWLHSWRRN